VAVVGGDVYTRDQFPAEYRNVYFFGDYNRGTIWMLPTDKRNAQVSEFATRLSGMVQITAGADGNLYVLSVRDGALHRIRWASTAP
jgi:glucose/arabinose dehydrogenase